VHPEWCFLGEGPSDMGRRQRISRGQRRILTGLLVAACLALGAFAVGISALTGGESAPVRGADAPEVAAAPDLANSELIEARAAGLDARRAAEKAAAREAAEEEAAAEQAAAEQAAAEQAAAEQAAAEQAAAEQAAAEQAAPAPAIPADTTMYLTVPKLGLNDIPVVEGTAEASLSQGAGHLSGSGYPWLEDSNTYIAGHRLGYPGTLSDHVFYYLPNLVEGDEIIITDSGGQTYTYAVSEILEVPITDLSVTTPVPGRDVVSLQTCIEDYGDYWTEGPNWFVRYVVRADRVS